MDNTECDNIKTPVDLRWAKIIESCPPTSVGNETIIIAFDDIISFKNVYTTKESIFRLNGENTGDGVCVVAGHRTVSVFAYSELIMKPRIFILTFPKFTKLHVLKSQHLEPYQDLRFSETDYLVVMSGAPRFQIEIWNWRTGKCLTTVETGVASPKQQLKCNRGALLTIGQYAPRSGKLIIWDLVVSIDQGCLTNRELKIPFASKNARIAFTFALDNTVYIVDNEGNVYSVPHGTLIPKLIWKWENSSGNKSPSISNYKGGYLVSGPSGDLKFFKKVEGTFTNIWTLSINFAIHHMIVLNYSEVYGINSNTTVIRLDDLEAEIKLEETHDTGERIKAFEFLQPSGEHLLTLVGSHELRLLEVHTGYQISLLELDYIFCIANHPTHPVVVVGDNSGVIQIVSYFDPTFPFVSRQLYLSNTGIEDMKFSHSGNILVVSDTCGHFFIISKILENKLNVLNDFEYQFPVIDYCILEDKQYYNIFILSTLKHCNQAAASKKSTLVTLNKQTNELKLSKMRLPSCYSTLSSVCKIPTELVATEYLTRIVHVLTYQKDMIRMTEILTTCHQIRHIFAFTDCNNIITYGIDGIICMFNSEFKDLEIVYNGHNRHKYGIHSVRCSPNQQFAISLGSKGNVKCFRIRNDPDRDYINVDTLPAFQKAAIESDDHTAEYSGKTYLEFKKYQQYLKELEMCKEEKQRIRIEFKEMQAKIKELIDHNETLSDDERLPLQSFNFREDWSQQVSRKAVERHEMLADTLKSYVQDQKRITKWIIENTWNQMDVKSCKLRGMFSRMFCENYPLLHQNSHMENNIKKIAMYRATERNVADRDSFLPWVPARISQLQLILSQRPEYTNTEPAYEASSPEMNRERSHLSYLQIKHKFSGTSTHEYITPIECRYNQLEVVTFQQMFQEDILGQHDMLNLRKFFNVRFNKMQKTKTDQLGQIVRRNDRLRVIQSELQILAEIKGSAEIYDPNILDPQYNMDEQPERIIKVEDWEVTVKPYISPSMQKLLDDEAYRLEQKRLALLADDFRERALMTMMDGVLEKRWEDEIKKFPPRPECLIEQKPKEDYTKEDYRDIFEYEKQFNFLASEREKYKGMLLEERTKLQATQDDQIKRYNLQCSGLFMLKLRVDAAMKEEEIKLLRNSIFNYDRMLFRRNDQELLDKMEINRIRIEEINQILDDLEKRVTEVRNRHEQLQNRDRLLDRQFKSQFGETTTPLIAEQAYKIFKRRPKWTSRAWATTAVLLDMASRIANRNNSKDGMPLPDECYEFLLLLEAFENYSNSPNTINQNLWHFLCNLRRYKMENEFKIKAFTYQLAEADATISHFLKEIMNRKNSLVEIEKEREELRKKYLDSIQNRTIQLVLPKGSVEVQLSGHMSDFEGCLLLNKSDVEDINSIIKQAGDIKIRAMERAALFRRKIIYKQWEHQMLKLDIRNLEDTIELINRIKVSKEIQMWLKRKQMGLPDDLSTTALNKAIESIRAYLNKSIEKINKELHKVSSQIDITRREMRFFDGEIARINIDITELNLNRNVALEERGLTLQKERYNAAMTRSKLSRKIQSQNAQILELSTMLELQRLRTFPTLDVCQKNIFS